MIALDYYGMNRGHTSTRPLIATIFAPSHLGGLSVWLNREAAKQRRVIIHPRGGDGAFSLRRVLGAVGKGDVGLRQGGAQFA